jgi:membrane associated rhomboid family serine protease
MKVNALMRPQPWRFATAALVHGSLMHLLVNSVSLSDIGHTFESLCGRDRTLAVYGCSAVCGNAISVFLNSNNALGASGAIMGLAGAFATTLGVNRRFLSPQAMEMRNTILRVVAINLAIGGVARGMVDNWGHIGGLLGGIASAYCFGPRLKRRGLQIVDEPPIPTFASTGSLARLTLRRLPPELR